MTMHTSSLLRMQWFVQHYLAQDKAHKKILDVGSYDVNGSYKRFFEEERFSYTGLDMVAGPNVDIVPGRPYHWTELEDDSFDVVISGQAFEHIEFFWVTAAEIARVLKKGGLLCLILPRGFALHRYPVDCYRFDADGMIALARYCNLIPLHASTNMAPEGSPSAWYAKGAEDSMLVAQKPEDWSGLLNVNEYAFCNADIKALTTGFVPPPPPSLPKRSFKTKLIDKVIGCLNKLR